MLTPADRRAAFPSLDEMVYLNTAAEGIPPPVVHEALDQYFGDKLLGMDGRDRHFAVLERAKALTAELFGLSVGEIAICSCSSEAYNLAAAALRLQPGDEVVINDLDFPAGSTPWLQETCPAEVRLWQSRQGRLEIDDLARLLTPRTRLVTVSLVSYYNGFKLDLQPVLERVHARSPALVAVDVTQALGRIELPALIAGADLVVSSTHKWILASHGGGLVGVPARRASEWTVPAGGWHHLQDAFGPGRFERAVSQPGAASFAVGMPNFPAIYCIEAALGYIRRVGVAAIDAAARPLVETCLAGVSKLPVELLSPSSLADLAGIVAFRHPQAERVHAHLRRHNIHLMHHTGRLRVALHGYNSPNDVEQFLRTMHEALAAVGSN